MNRSSELTPEEIARLLPHAAPFILVDRVVELDPGRHGKGVKNVTGGDPFLTGHFPGRPIMPGVMIVEACGQLAAIVCGSETPTEKTREPAHEPEEESPQILAMIDHFKFLHPVVPGDQLVLEAAIGKKFQNMVRMSVSARVGSRVVAEGVLIGTRA